MYLRPSPQARCPELQHPKLAAALASVRNGCHIARQVQHQLEAVREITKDDHSPVTVADFAVQASILLELQGAQGDLHLAGEENADLLRDPEHELIRDEVVAAVRTVHPAASAETVLDAIDTGSGDALTTEYWTLDPIDGTKGFLRGGQYAIALGLIVDGEVVLGVMGCPNLDADPNAGVGVGSGVLFAAVRKQGACVYSLAEATAAPQPVGARQDNDTALRVCESVEAAHSKHSVTARVVEAMQVDAESIRVDSQCKYGLVARGQADVYLRFPTDASYVEKIWDHAAGSLIAQEAGAVVTDIQDRALDFSHGRYLSENRGIVCATPDVHRRLIDVINALGFAEPR